MNETSYESFFSALACGRRLGVLQFLVENGSQSVTEVAEGTGLEQSAVSHCLGKLLDCQFVHVEVRGKHRYFAVNQETVVPMLKLMDEHIAKYCADDCQECIPTAQAAKARAEAAVCD